MSNTVIKVENIAKQYRLGEVGTGSLSHDVNRWWHKVRGKEDPYLKIGDSNDRTQKGNTDYVWALKNINFEVKQGEVLGIIGRNGAGKSTLLKILSRTTAPTIGSIKIKGRIASLLEVGTGFHPELSGRDNIYLNGAILGMSKQEITRKFDEIVDFAGVERYINTPVKRYSSGMYVRLAFAVAAHLESEILIVDEVLAVGDAEFQTKCLGKMKDVSTNGGRTVLFVSHNMAAVKQLCNKGIILKNGAFEFEGSTLEAITHYQKISGLASSYFHQGTIQSALGNHNIRILKFSVQAISQDFITISSGLSFNIEFYNHNTDINLDVTIELKTNDDLVILHIGKLVTQNKDSMRGIYFVSGELPPYFLNAGIYKFKVIFGQDQRIALYIKDDIVQFEVLNEAIGSNNFVRPGFSAFQIPFTHSFKQLEDAVATDY